MALKLERCLEVSKLCQDILSYDQIIFVAAINQNGRMIDSKFRNDRKITNLLPQELEMYFMQRVLQMSLTKELDDKLEQTQYLIIERKSLIEFLFPFHKGVVIVITESKIIPRFLAKKVSLMIKSIEISNPVTHC